MFLVPATQNVRVQSIVLGVKGSWASPTSESAPGVDHYVEDKNSQVGFSFHQQSAPIMTCHWPFVMRNFGHRRKQGATKKSRPC